MITIKRGLLTGYAKWKKQGKLVKARWRNRGTKRMIKAKSRRWRY